MRYEFVVKDAVLTDLADEVPELRRAGYPTGGTSFFGPVRDAADVETFLARFWSLGLSVIAVRQLPD